MQQRHERSLEAPRWAAGLEGNGRLYEQLQAETARRELAETELAAVRYELATELDGIQLLRAVSQRFVSNDGPGTLLEEILDATIDITRADFRNLQLIDPATCQLKGFNPEVAHRPDPRN
jgi:hypothetical protein